MSHIFQVLLFFFYTFLMPIVPPFMLRLDLLACAKLTNHWDREKKPPEIWQCHWVWHKPWAKERLGKQNKCTDEGWGWGGGRWLQTMRNCFATLLHSHMRAKVAHLAVEHKSSTLVLSLWRRDGQKEKEKESRNSCRGGVGQSCSSATQTDHSGKNVSLVLVCWAVTF